MYIDYERLAAKGYTVVPSTNGLEIRGNRPLDLSPLRRALDDTNLSGYQADSLMDEFGQKLEATCLINDL